MGKRKQRVQTSGGGAFGSNPFASLDGGGLPDGPSPQPDKPVAPEQPPTKAKKSRGRLDVRREKSGRGGKTVTVVMGFKGIAAEEKAMLAKSIQKRCGVGGGVKNGNIEIQGDKREETKAALEQAGFTVVFTGG